MISSIISRLVILVFGTLYPAYASYKAVRTKNLKEYVKWMMYWIVFALFTCTETITDVFLSWFPFYYEVKIVLVLWLLSPATRGSSILYRKFVHPALCRREQEIDEYIAKAKDQGYHTVLNLGTKGVNYATTVIMQTAIKGGGGLVQQLRKSYSLSDLSDCEPRGAEAAHDEADDVLSEPRLIRRPVARSGYNTRRSASESNSRAPIYFPEVDVDLRGARASRDEHDFSHIKSSEDISSGYSSADNSAAQQLSRAGSVGAAARARTRHTTRTAITTIKRPAPAEDSEVIIEEMADDDSLDYVNMPPLLNVSSPMYLSHSNPPFIYQYVGDQVKIIQVLGNYPLSDETNSDAANKQEKDNTNNCKNREQTVISDENSQVTNSEINSNNDVLGNKFDENNHSTNRQEQFDATKHDDVKITTLEYVFENEKSVIDIHFEKDDCLDSTSLDTASFTEHPSAESDDEASFGTPDDSPRSKRKSPSIGKYGKRKAPSPPKTKNINVSGEANIQEYGKTLNENTDIISSRTNLTDLPDPLKRLQAINPIAEKKKRHKSKSPARNSKSNNSPIGKLLQLPGKFAFWNKNEDKRTDTLSTSSGNESRRSSTIEQDAFESCSDLNFCDKKASKDATTDQIVTEIQSDSSNIGAKSEDVESEIITQDIIDKSDILKKLIVAKIESHPEYKFVSLHDEEIPTCSKSTEV